MGTRISVLVTDLDNTLWDWVHIWHATFATLIDVLVDEGGLDRETLLDEAREIHQRHATSEYSLLLEELPSYVDLSARTDATALKASAVAASQKEREKALALYPGVAEALVHIRTAGAVVVAYTESMAFTTAQRVRKLELDGVIQYLYSSPDHDFPQDAPPQLMRQHSDEHYALKETKHRHVARGVLKPNAEVLRQIMNDVGATPEATVYVGDNIMKDVAMAKQAGVIDVLAGYGAAQQRDEYDLLRRVTHWPKADVDREREMIAAGELDATFILEKEFAELLDLFEFISRNRPTA